MWELRVCFLYFPCWKVICTEMSIQCLCKATPHHFWCASHQRIPGEKYKWSWEMSLWVFTGAATCTAATSAGRGGLRVQRPLVAASKIAAVEGKEQEEVPGVRKSARSNQSRPFCPPEVSEPPEFPSLYPLLDTTQARPLVGQYQESMLQSCPSPLASATSPARAARSPPPQCPSAKLCSYLRPLHHTGGTHSPSCQEEPKSFHMERLCGTLTILTWFLPSRPFAQYPTS